MSEHSRNGYEIVNNIIKSLESEKPSGFCFSDFLSRIEHYVIEYSESRIGRHENHDCETEYTENHLETFVWALGLISLEWTLEILHDKIRDGHCYTHKRKTGKPCPQGSAFHMRLYELCKKNFEEVLEAHERLGNGNSPHR